MLEAIDLEKRYRRRPVVRGVSLTVDRGEVVGLLGPNGAGKTTCFDMIVGHVPCDGGRVVLDGEDVTRRPMHVRAARGLGYLPQEASVFRDLDVAANIMAALELRQDLDRKGRRAELDALLQELQIEELRHRGGAALSGGERRRVEIARALAANPRYMLLDEPFAGVDPISVGDIRQIVRHLTDRGVGVLVTDHNVRETLAICDRATIIAGGSVLTSGVPDAILADNRVREVYLGGDFTL